MDGWMALFHPPTYLEPAEHEGLEKGVGLGEHGWVDGLLNEVEAAGEDGLAPLGEHVGEEEVEQRPQLAQAVLVGGVFGVGG